MGLLGHLARPHSEVRSKSYRFFRPRQWASLERGAGCPSWVNFRHGCEKSRCPLYPNERTSRVTAAMSERCRYCCKSLFRVKYENYLPIADSCAAANLSVRTSPGGWRSPERLLEGAGKSSLGTVTDQVGNLRKGRAGIAELLGRDLHAPTSDVVHRRHADQTNEAVGERRTRQADLTANVLHAPRPGDVVM